MSCRARCHPLKTDLHRVPTPTRRATWTETDSGGTAARGAASCCATSVWVSSWGAELPDERSLPGDLHRMPVIVRPHERHRVCRRDAVNDGDAGQGSAGAAPTTRARHLDSLERRALPRCQHGPGERRAVARRPEIRPRQPLVVPLEPMIATPEV